MQCAGPYPPALRCSVPSNSLLQLLVGSVTDRSQTRCDLPMASIWIGKRYYDRAGIIGAGGQLPEPPAEKGIGENPELPRSGKTGTKVVKYATEAPQPWEGTTLVDKPPVSPKTSFAGRLMAAKPSISRGGLMLRWFLLFVSCWPLSAVELPKIAIRRDEEFYGLGLLSPAEPADNFRPSASTTVRADAILAPSQAGYASTFTRSPILRESRFQPRCDNKFGPAVSKAQLTVRPSLPLTFRKKNVWGLVQSILVTTPSKRTRFVPSNSAANE
jgi:hypothetical protein